MKARVSVKEDERSLVFALPREFVDFYALEKTITGVSRVRDAVFLIMEVK